MLQRNLPTPIETAAAKLPANYQAAKSALANCASLDECMSWGDKMEALASYAKQAKDDELMRYATRVRDRAIRRAGELLKQIEPGKTGPKPELSIGSDTQFTRRDAAEAAGMSKRQQVTAIRVANVPAEDFEKQVDSANPPTVTALAEQEARAASGDRHKGPRGRRADQGAHEERCRKHHRRRPGAQAAEGTAPAWDVPTVGGGGVWHELPSCRPLHGARRALAQTCQLGNFYSPPGFFGTR